MESLQSNPKLEESEQNPKFEEQPEQISKVEEEGEASISLPSKRDSSVPHESPTPMEEHNSREEASEPISKSEEEAQVPISFPKELDSVPHDESSAAVEEQISIIQEEPEVSVLPPGSVLPSELDDSVLRESSAAIEEQNGAELENVDVAMNVDRPGSDLKIESDSFSEEAPTASSSDNPKSPKPEIAVSAMEEDEGEEEEDDPPPKKQKQLASLVKEEEQGQPSEAMVVEETVMVPAVSAAKKSKSKKKNNNVWVTKSTRKGKKKSKTNTPSSVAVEDKVLITPVPRFPDKGDDTPDSEICLSKVYKAEKVEISEDRLTAGSSKGYRMVRATRGAVEGAWYFEIKVVNLGETGHTRLGWSTDKGDLQAPVGYDGNSFGFRDIDGCKIHKALREKYAEEGYKEGDVIGFYINLPDGESFAPKPPHYVFYKGQRYVSAPDAKEEPPKAVPGSEISFFKNGVCQGVAFKDLLGGRYYPAASMYTLPDQSNCVVKFNFGPDFDFFPEDFGGRVTPKPMCEVPYHGYNGRLENNGSDDMKS